MFISWRVEVEKQLQHRRLLWLCIFIHCMIKQYAKLVSFSKGPISQLLGNWRGMIPVSRSNGLSFAILKIMVPFGLLSIWATCFVRCIYEVPQLASPSCPSRMAPGTLLFHQVFSQTSDGNRKIQKRNKTVTKLLSGVNSRASGRWKADGRVLTDENKIRKLQSRICHEECAEGFHIYMNETWFK